MKRLIQFLLLAVAATAFADRRGQLMEQGQPVTFAPPSLVDAVAYYPFELPYFGFDTTGHNHGLIDDSGGLWVYTASGKVNGGVIITNWYLTPTNNNFPQTFQSVTYRFWIKIFDFPFTQTGFGNPFEFTGCTLPGIGPSVEVGAKKNGGGDLVPAIHLRPTLPSNSDLGWTSGTATFPLNQWTHFVVTFTNGVATLYQNASNIITQAFSGAYGGNCGFYIGDSRVAWKGYVDEWGLWTNAWSSDQVLYDYNGGAGRTYP